MRFHRVVALGKWRLLSATRTGRMCTRFVCSWWHGRRAAKSFEDVESYCMFVGYPRSGHSLIGALLDAHPEILIANELSALRYVAAGFSRNQLFFLLWQRSQEFVANGCTGGGGYTYFVPGQWQGKFKTLRVIGDKQGGGSALSLQKRFHLLDRLQRLAGLPVKIIHVTRNPFDNVATIAGRMGLSLGSAADFYFSRCEIAARVKAKIESEARQSAAPRFAFYNLRHEDFIADPRNCLKELCDFLGVAAPAEYLEACAKIVYQSPHQSRHKAQWSPELKASMEERIAQYPFLSRYRFDD